MNNDPHSGPSVPAAAVLDRSRRARIRLGRSILPLFGAGVVLCTIVVWYRDTRHIEAAKASMEAYMAPVARYLAETGTLPSVYPRYPGQAVSDKEGGFSYVDQQVIKWARRTDVPAIIGYGPSRGLIAVPNGHPVIIFDGGGLRIGWISKKALGPRLEEQARLAQKGAEVSQKPVSPD